MEKVVVEVTGVMEDPDVGSGPLPSCKSDGVIVTDVALVVSHVIVVVCPAFNSAGVALKVMICGGTGCTTCTVAV
jgi:hypothetical protein